MLTNTAKINQSKSKSKSKKKLIALSLSATLALMSVGSHADTILGVYAGAGIWDSSFDGTFETDGSVTTDELGIDGGNNTFFYIALEHPVPILPNVKLSILDLTTDAQNDTGEGFEFNGQTYAAGIETDTTIDFSHVDVTLYWELLDNWVNFDLGLTVRTFDGFAEVNAESGGESLNERVDLAGSAPMAYVKAQFDLPFTGWFVAGTLNYVGYSGNNLTDFDAKLGYMHEGLVLDVGVELGYRAMTVETEDLDDLEADLTIDGPYASLVVHF